MNENNSMAYAPSDDTLNDSSQSYSVYAQNNTAQYDAPQTAQTSAQETGLNLTQDTAAQAAQTSAQEERLNPAQETNLNTAQDTAAQPRQTAPLEPAPYIAQNTTVQAGQDIAQNNTVHLQKNSAPDESVQSRYSAPDNTVQNNPVYTPGGNMQGSPNIAMAYNNTPLLQLNDLCKRYPGMGTYMSVFHMNLIIPRGRIIGLLGPNGCGKTTLIKMINGLLTPTCGTVLINGMQPCPATKKVISYLPERTYLDNSMKVSQMVSYFADFYEDFSTEKAYGMLGALGISSDARLKTLSKGTKEKVQLILVMSRQADLYILDEPIAGVDPAARDYILRTIITNYNPNSTIILSTHLISDIENVLDDVIFMKNGSLMLYTSVDSIRSQMGKSVDSYFREVYAC